MIVAGVKLDNRRENFVKELLGDVFMTDTRAEAILAKACAKYNVDPKVLVEVGAHEKTPTKSAPPESL